MDGRGYPLILLVALMASVDSAQAARLLRDAVDRHDADLNGQMGTFVYLMAVLVLDLYDRDSRVVSGRLRFGQIVGDWRAVLVSLIGLVAAFVSQTDFAAWIRGGSVAVVFVSAVLFFVVVGHEA